MAIKINGDNSTSAVGLSGGDDDSGIKPGTDQVEIVTGGTARVTVANGTTTVSNTLSGAAADFSGNVDVGNNITLDASGGGATFSGVVQSGGNADNGSQAGTELKAGGRVVVTSDNDSDSLVQGFKTGTSTATTELKANGSILFNTNESNNNAVIRVRQQGSNNNNFSVTGDGAVFINGTRGATNPVPGISLNANGVIAVANGGGIDFSATADSSGTMASELFDDYEEGTWTPTVSGATLSTAVGRYVKVGKLVTLWYNCNSTNVSGTGGTDIEIAGIPFAVGNSHSVSGSVRTANGLDFSEFLTVNRNGASTAIAFIRNFTDSNGQPLEFGDLAGNFFHLTGSFTYESS